MTERQRAALVTGGVRGIGWAACEALRQHGWQVVVGDVDAESVAARDAPDRNVHGVVLDVTDQGSVDAAVAATVERCGRFDLLVNNAGVHGRGRLEDLDLVTDWGAVLDVNLHGVLRCLQAAGRHMLAHGGGSIVNVTSIAGARGVSERVAYAASKAAVVAITQTAALEWATAGIRVNAVGPGFVHTELMAELVAAGTIDLRPVLHRTPMRRLGEPAEIGRVIRFLASDDASYITGQVLYADGGFLADYGVAPGPGR